MTQDRSSAKKSRAQCLGRKHGFHHPAKHPTPGPGQPGSTCITWPGLAWLAGLVLLALSVLPTATHAEAPGGRITELKVVVDHNYPPYIFRDQAGLLQGILVDQWALWQKKTGIKVKLDAINWGEAQDRMLRGEYDVIDTMFRDQARDQTYDFTDPYVEIEVPIFFHAEMRGIAAAKDLAGLEVGVQAGDSVLAVLASEGVTKLKKFHTYEEIVQAAARGEIKVFVADQPPALYLLRKYGLTEAFKETRPINTGHFHRAVLKGNTRVLEVVKQGFAQIDRAEYDAMDRKWLDAPIAPGK